jgi:hypothetical protein
MGGLLAPLIGVLIGAALASAYNFWAIRRSELERAVVAGSIVDDELLGIGCSLLADAGKGRALDSSALTKAWEEHRHSLVMYLSAERFQELASAVRRARQGDISADELEGIRQELAQRTATLRAEHQAFIMTPLFKYLASRPWSRKHSAAEPA